MRKQSNSRDRTKERCFNWRQPIFLRTIFYEMFQGLKSSLNQIFAVPDVMMLTRIDLTDRRIAYIGWHTQKLTEQVDCFPNVTINETD